MSMAGTPFNLYSIPRLSYFFSITIFMEFVSDNKEDKVMAYAIGDACVACGACESQCPVGAISMGDGQTFVFLFSHGMIGKHVQSF